MAESHIEKKEKRDGQRPKKKWKWMKAQSANIWYAKGIREKNKREAQSAWKKREKDREM